MIKTVEKERKRTNIRRRIRSKMTGTAERPRLAIFKSLTRFYAQLIDDASGTTLAAASSGDAGLLAKGKGGANSDAARLVGEAIAERALAKGIKQVVFDRGGYRYHGNVKTLAEAAREKGLSF